MAVMNALGFIILAITLKTGVFAVPVPLSFLKMNVDALDINIRTTYNSCVNSLGFIENPDDMQIIGAPDKFPELAIRRNLTPGELFSMHLQHISFFEAVLNDLIDLPLVDLAALTNSVVANETLSDIQGKLNETLKCMPPVKDYILELEELISGDSSEPSSEHSNLQWTQTQNEMNYLLYRLKDYVHDLKLDVDITFWNMTQN